MRRCTPVFPATQTDVGESPASLSTPAIGSGSRSALTQPMGRFAESPGQRFDGAMKIIQHADCFEVRSEDGLIVRQFAFDDNAPARDLAEDDQETSLPSRQDFCRQELYGRNGEAVTGLEFCGRNIRRDLARLRQLGKPK